VQQAKKKDSTSKAEQSATKKNGSPNSEEAKESKKVEFKKEEKTTEAEKDRQSVESHPQSPKSKKQVKVRDPKSPSMDSLSAKERKPSLGRKGSEGKSARTHNGTIAQTSYPLPDKFHGPISVFQQDDGGMLGLTETGEPMDEHYFVGIIDILMLYTLRKKVEHTYKSLRFAKDEISSVDPLSYSKRFQHFVHDTID